jgi:hypothetical protein
MSDAILGTFREAGAILLVVFACSNVILIVLGIRRFRTAGVAACGHCGHAVHSLASARCAECGGKYVQNGVQAGQVRPGFPTWILAGLVLVLGVVFILAIRGVVRSAVDKAIPIMATSYVSSDVKSLDPALFSLIDDDGNAIEVSLHFNLERINMEDSAQHYKWTPSAKWIELLSKSGGQSSSLAPQMSMATEVEPEEVMQWFLDAGAVHESEEQQAELALLVEEVVEGVKWYRNGDGKPPRLNIKSAGRSRSIPRVPWISTTIEIAVFALFGLLALIVLGWSGRRARRLRRSRTV